MDVDTKGWSYLGFIYMPVVVLYTSRGIKDKKGDSHWKSAKVSGKLFQIYYLSFLPCAYHLRLVDVFQTKFTAKRRFRILQETYISSPAPGSPLLDASDNR
jgi:hypothetical protein